MTVNKEQIFGVFDQLMASQVDWRIGTSYTKYAMARDNLIEEFSKKTGIASKEFYDHLAMKLAKSIGVI